VSDLIIGLAQRQGLQASCIFCIRPPPSLPPCLPPYLERNPIIVGGYDDSPRIQGLDDLTKEGGREEGREERREGGVGPTSRGIRL